MVRSSGQSISFSILNPRSVFDNKIIIGKQLSPSHLPSVQLFSCNKVFQILMICENGDCMLCSLKVGTPLFQTNDNSQHLLVMNLIVDFSRSEFARQKSDRANEARSVFL